MTHGGPRAGGPALLSGVQTVVQLLVLRHELDRRAGRSTATMVSGYPGSPLGALDLALDAAAEELAAAAVRHQPGLNEELALATVWGSQMGAVVDYAGVDGVVGAWYGKTPGLDRSGDALKHANAMGAGPGGGAVLFCGDDPTAKSSTLTCDSQHAFEDACVPVLVPADPQEVLDLGLHAFGMSRFAGCWVGVKVVTAVADGVATVDLDPARHDLGEPPDVVVGGHRWEHQPLRSVGPHTVAGQEELVVEHRLRAARAWARHHRLDRVLGAGPGARLGIVCAGTGFGAVVGALTDLGVPADRLGDAGVRILKLGMTWPLVEETVLEFAGTVDEVVVIEEKRPFVEVQLRSILHEAGHPVPVSGKRDRRGEALVPVVGELDAAAVAAVLARVRPDLAPPPSRPRLPVVEVPPRPPAYCSGCPHNRSTVLPDGVLAGGGVGCHGIMYFEARQQGVTKLPPTPMGAEGVPWIGLAPFVDEPHLIQNLGDGTLSHSGTLAIRASVAAGVDVTYKILYNSAVAMTGGQAVTGLPDVPALTRALEAEGVTRVVVCSDDRSRYGRRARWAPGVEVHDRDRLPEVQDALRRVRGVTVIIYDQQCAAEARRLRRRGLQPEPPRRVVINEAVCEGCGDCGVKSNCLSVVPVATELGEKRQVHDPSCNRDETCLDGDCPSFVTIEPVRPRPWRRRPPAPTAPVAPPLPAGTLPEPELPAPEGTWGIYLTGIGGTGVVTAARIVAAAAAEEGFSVGGLDQTGLSQKAGAVVSHLRLSRDPAAVAPAGVGASGADLYLSGDLLQAAAPVHLERIRPDHTVAVVAAGVTPTAAMLQGATRAPDPAVLERTIRARVGSGRVAVPDARRVAEVVFADHLLANVVLLGAAFQLGGLPLSAARLDAAMGRQARGAASNRDAFAWGRWLVHDPVAAARALEIGERARPAPGQVVEPSGPSMTIAAELVAAGPAVLAALPDELSELVVRRAALVVDHQDRRRGARFVDLVGRVAAVDGPDCAWQATRAVAEAWCRVLAYKDEYEVARLHRSTDYDQVARELGIDGPYRLRYHLHPPVLRRLGRHRKLPLGRTYDVAFAVLERMKRLRGTWFDPFGVDPDRRLERALVDEYEGLVIDRVARVAEPGGYDALVELARSAMEIRGYASIKEDAYRRWRDRVGSMTTPGPAGA